MPKGFWMDEITPEEFRTEYPHLHCGRGAAHDGHGWRGVGSAFDGAVEVYQTFWCAGVAPHTPADAEGAPCG